VLRHMIKHIPLTGAGRSGGCSTGVFSDPHACSAPRDTDSIQSQCNAKECERGDCLNEYKLKCTQSRQHESTREPRRRTPNGPPADKTKNKPENVRSRKWPQYGLDDAPEVGRVIKNLIGPPKRVTACYQTSYP